MRGDCDQTRLADLAGEEILRIVKSLPETDIRIAEDKGGVKIAADRFDSRLHPAA
jgi:hypothetical protein